MSEVLECWFQKRANVLYLCATHLRELNIFGLHHLAGSAPAIEIETKSVSSKSYAATVRARQEGRVKALECIRMRAYQEVA